MEDLNSFPPFCLKAQNWLFFLRHRWASTARSSTAVGIGTVKFTRPIAGCAPTKLFFLHVLCAWLCIVTRIFFGRSPFVFFLLGATGEKHISNLTDIKFLFSGVSSVSLVTQTNSESSVVSLIRFDIFLSGISIRTIIYCHDIHR